RKHSSSVRLGGTGFGRENAPIDELFTELSRGHVVDDRQRAQVLGTHRQDFAVVVTTLALDGGRIASERSHLLGGAPLQPFQVDDDFRCGSGAGPSSTFWQ